MSVVLTEERHSLHLRNDVRKLRIETCAHLSRRYRRAVVLHVTTMIKVTRCLTRLLPTFVAISPDFCHMHKLALCVRRLEEDFKLRVTFAFESDGSGFVSNARLGNRVEWFPGIKAGEARKAGASQV